MNKDKIVYTYQVWYKGRKLDGQIVCNQQGELSIVPACCDNEVNDFEIMHAYADMQNCNDYEGWEFKKLE